MENEKTKSIFDNFTRQYSLSKTLRFELKPLPATRNYLEMDKQENDKIFPKDKERAKNYIMLKGYLDLLHRDFIKERLSEFKKIEKSIDFGKVYKCDKETEVKENIDEDENNLEIQKDEWAEQRKKIANSFKNNGFLFEKEVIDHLVAKFRDERELFENFRGFVGYLRGFFENRKNLYKDEGKSGSVATRIVDQNLPRFFENIDKLGIILKEYPNAETIFSDCELWKNYFDEKGLSDNGNIRKFAAENYNWKKIFEANYYNFCFLQDDINFYNYIVKKLNKDIFQYRQQLIASKKERQGAGVIKKNKLRLFAVLHKQILGEIKKKSDFIEITRPTIGEVLSNFIKHSDERKDLAEKIIIENFIEKEDASGIYISNKAINTISSKWFSSWDYFGGKILEKENEGKPESKKHKRISDFIPVSVLKNVLNEIGENREIIFKKERLDGIDQSDNWRTFLNVWKKEWDEMIKGEDGYEKSKSELLAVLETIKKDDQAKITQSQKQVIKAFADASLALYQMTKYFALLKGVKEVQKEDKDDIFYATMDVYLFGGEFNGKECEENKIYIYYNVFRNFLTQKEWKEDKIKLCFGSGHLLDGWSKNKEKDNLGIILRDNDKYYLVILNDASFLKNKSLYDKTIDGCYEKMEMLSLKWKTLTGKAYKRDFGDKYSNHVFDFKIDQYGKYLSGNNINIPDLDKWIEAENDKKSADNKFPDDKKIIDKIIKFIEKKDSNDIRIKELKELEDEPCDFAIGNLQKLIEKQFIQDYPILEKFLNRKFATRAEFENYKEKYGKEIYSVNFDKKIKKEIIESAIKMSDTRKPFISLFQIYNKDFQLDERLRNGAMRQIEGKEDEETTIFKMLFDSKNLENKNGVILTLNGGAEVFYRESSIEKKEEVRNFKRKIERKKRYTENKMFLHIPYTLNFGKRPGKNFPINDIFNREILQNQEISKKVKIIGIDRGENNLAYYSVIDQTGNILEQGSLNRIYEKKKSGGFIERNEKRIVFDKDVKRYVLKPTGNKVPYTDYLVLLQCIEKNRLLERKSWEVIESIKDLKRGYISHVVRRLSDLIFKYLEQDGIPPIIVFEKLNIGFKRGRQKIERQSYQNLELGIAKKLGYLTQKNRDENEIGGILNALQFTPEIKNFGNDVEKKYQLGSIFYVDPSYTSATCPNCGFRKRINKTVFESPKKTIKKLEDHSVKIYFKDGRYKFVFSGCASGRNGKMCNFDDYIFSDVERIYRKPKENGKGWVADKFADMTDELEKLFKNKFGNKLEKDKEIFSQIKDCEDKEFWRLLMWYFNLLLQIRNSSNKKYALNEKTKEVDEEGFDVDFINCPRCHFHSGNVETWNLFGEFFSETLRKSMSERGEELFNGDANGAYNIARKVILAIKRIRKHPEMKADFLKSNNMTEEELSRKFKSNSGRCEIKIGKGKNKKVVDSISKNPDLIVDNIEWDEAVNDWGQFYRK